MATNRINPLTFRHLKATDVEQTLSDGGGLFVRVRSLKDGGSISFRFCYRFEGKQKWTNLKAKGLSEARSERDSLKLLLKTGVDPNLEKDLEKERKRRQQLDEQEALVKLKARVTVRQLFVRWRDTDLIKNIQYSKEISRMFEKDVLPTLGDLFVEDVRKGHVIQIIDRLLIRGVNRMAKLIFGLIRQMFRFAVERDIIEFDPTASIRKSRIGGKDVERDRTLSDIEIKALARQVPSANLMKSSECAVWIALSTLCRIGELSKAKFSDLDFEMKTWTIPETNSKNGRAHTIYLSDFALAQFKILKSIATNATWLFPNLDNSNHVGVKSITQQICSRQSATILSKRSYHNQALVLVGGKWTPHDLRRTGATLMGDLGIRPDVIEKCLNHTERNKVKRTYQRQELRLEQINAWRVLGERLELLVSEDAVNVVFMHKRL